MYCTIQTQVKRDMIKICSKLIQDFADTSTTSIIGDLWSLHTALLVHVNTLINQLTQCSLFPVDASDFACSKQDTVSTCFFGLSSLSFGCSSASLSAIPKETKLLAGDKFAEGQM